MAYFSNGSEGDNYEHNYCSRCIHGSWLREDDGKMCAVMEAHLLKNYEECNNKDSILHILIPRDGIWNAECRMFVEEK